MYDLILYPSNPPNAGGLVSGPFSERKMAEAALVAALRTGKFTHGNIQVSKAPPS